MSSRSAVEGLASRVVAEIGRVASGGELRMEFQPIFELETWHEIGRVVGYEALARFDSGTGPQIVLEIADLMGLRTPLELSAVRHALRFLGKLPADTFMTVNVSPSTAADSHFAQMLSELPSLGGLMIEIAEPQLVNLSSYQRFEINRLRSLGLRVAVDDVGAGMGDLGLARQLGADAIKIDITVTRGIDTDPIRQNLVEMLVDLAHGSREAEAMVIAEGIETSEELANLIHAGVPFGQGYWLARPGALAELLG